MEKKTTNLSSKNKEQAIDARNINGGLSDNGKTQSERKTQQTKNNSSNGKSGRQGKGGGHGGNGKGNKPHNGNSEREITPKRGSGNSPFWYAKDEQAIKDIASIPFLDIVGAPIGGPTDLGTNSALPAIVVATYAHCLGSNPDTALIPQYADYRRKAATALFQNVCQGYTSMPDFEAPDLLMSVVAGASLMTFATEFQRAFGILNYFISQNSYYCKSIIEALGFNYEDLRTHIADYRGRYNMLVSAINEVIAVPKPFFLHERWALLSGNIYSEHAAAPEYATLYAYRCTQPLEYDATTETTGTSLRFIQSIEQNKLLTGEDFFKTCELMLQKLLDADVRNMFAAIKRVYSKEQLYQIQPLQVDYLQPIAHDSVMEMEFHNMKYYLTSYKPANKKVYGLNTIVRSDQLDVKLERDLTCAVYQDSLGNICSRLISIDGVVVLPGPDGSLSFGGGNTLIDAFSNTFVLDFHDNDTTPGMVLDATANMQVLETSDTLLNFKWDNSSYYSRIIQCRSEVITNVIAYGTNPKSYISTAASEYLAVPQFIDADDVAVPETVLYASSLGCAPIVYCKMDADHGFWYLGNIAKYTTVTAEFLIKLHNKCFFTLLGLPDASKSVTK